MKINRRHALGIFGAAALLAGCASHPTESAHASRPALSNPPLPANPTPAEALAAMVAGNERFVADRPSRRHAIATAKDLAKAQHPFALVLGCSDSRVAPEILFDQGVGDLFVVRTAGQVADRAVVGTVEFAVEELSVPLLVVLGHERCGAVTAAVAAHDSGQRPAGDLGYLVEQIEPVVDGAAGDRLDRAVRKNVARVVAQLGAVPVVADRTGAGKLRVVGARYDLDDGRLELLN